MGRPRKDPNTIEAKDRLVDTFWTLLETENLHSITVGNIVAKAGCNRGTFYYHYENIEALINHAIEKDLLGSCGSAMTISNVLLEHETPIIDPVRQNSLKHASLMMRHGGYDLYSSTVKSLLQRVWNGMCEEEGEEVAYETELFFEFFVSGVLGVMNHIANDIENGMPTENLPRTAYVNNLPAVMISELSRTQNLTPEELISRIERNRRELLQG